MKTIVAIATVLTLVLAGPTLAADKKKKEKIVKEFSKQPWINQALTHLAAARDALSGGGGGTAKAIESLQKAEEPLKSVATRGAKGSTGEYAQRLATQAIKDLEAGLTENAAVKIEKAIVAARAAGGGSIAGRKEAQKAAQKIGVK